MTAANRPESLVFAHGSAPCCKRDCPFVFLPGGFHLPTIPPHRKVNAIDLGTADKVAVAALALWFDGRELGRFDESTFAVVEIGSAFTAILVVENGRLVDASAGTRGPIGIRSRGAWDGEIAYWMSPLSKHDLFRGGLDDLGPSDRTRFANRSPGTSPGFKAVTPFQHIYLSGLGLNRPDVAALVDRGALSVRSAHQPSFAPGRLGQARRPGIGPPGRRSGRRFVRRSGPITADRPRWRIGLGRRCQAP